MVSLDSLLNAYTRERAVECLTLVMASMASTETDFEGVLAHLLLVVEVVLKVDVVTKDRRGEEDAIAAANAARLLANVDSLVAQCVCGCLASLPPHVAFDTASKLISRYFLDKTVDTVHTTTAVLCDIWTQFPQHVLGLNGLLLLVLYRVWRNGDNVLLPAVVQLLALVVARLSKQDLPDKLHAKLMKQVARVVRNSEANVLEAKHALALELRCIAFLAGTNYTALATKMAAKKKKTVAKDLEEDGGSEAASAIAALHTQQLAFQTTLLNTTLPVWFGGLAHPNLEVRLGAAHALASALADLIPTPDEKPKAPVAVFDPVVYLTELYFSGRSLYPGSPSTAMLLEFANGVDNGNLLRTGLVETLVTYYQMLLVRDPDSLGTSTMATVEQVVTRIGASPDPRVYAHWHTVMRFLARNNGTAAGEYHNAQQYKRILTRFFGLEVGSEPGEALAPSAAATYFLLDTLDTLAQEVSGALVEPAYLPAITTWLYRQSVDHADFTVRIRSLELLVHHLHHVDNYRGVNALVDAVFADVSSLVTNQKLAVELDKAMVTALVLARLLGSPPAHLLRALLLKIMSWCTHHLKNKAATTEEEYHAVQLRSSACWVVLAGLATELNLELVQLNSAQLLILFKNLFSHTFNAASVPGADEAGQRVAVAANLRVRNHGMVALSAFLGCVPMTPELVKQASTILARLFAYVLSLEAGFKEVVVETKMDPAQPAMFMPAHDETAAKELVVYHKKMIVWEYVHLAPFIDKSDVNTNLMMFAVRTFGDASYWGRVVEEPKETKARAWDWYRGDDNLCYGLTSQFSLENASRDGLDGFEGAHPFLLLEVATTAPIVRTPYNDPLLRLLPNAALLAVPLVTQLVDLSISLFGTYFPHLSHKIQMLLVETVRAQVAKNKESPRHEAVTINCLKALHEAVVGLKGEVDPELHQILQETLRQLPSPNPTTLDWNAESIAVLALYTTAGPLQQVAHFTDTVVASLDPAVRSHAVATLGYIFQHSQQQFEGVFLVVTQLVKDTHPALHHHALAALVRVVQHHYDIAAHVREIALLVEMLVYEDAYGYRLALAEYVELRSRYRLVLLVSLLVRATLLLLGPNVRAVDEYSRGVLARALAGMAVGLGCQGAFDYEAVSGDLLATLQELVFYDPNLVEGQLGLVKALANLHIQRGTLVACRPFLGTSVPLGTSRERVFDLLPSTRLQSAAVASYAELVKVHGPAVLPPHIRDLVWVCMDLAPSEALADLVLVWMEGDERVPWVARLVALYQLPRTRLLRGFNERVAKAERVGDTSKSAELELDDDEAAGIVVEGEAAVLSEPVGWRMRRVVARMLRLLVEEGATDAAMKKALAARLPELVRISFAASLSGVVSLVLAGVELLAAVMATFGSTTDPLYPDVSILEQQQAQMILAIVPCFAPGCDPLVVVAGIQVAASFLNLPRLAFQAKQRILAHLEAMLKETALGEYVAYAHLAALLEVHQRSIRSTLLNTWAVFKLGSTDTLELGTVIASHELVLVPMWVRALQEYGREKYGENRGGELDDGEWIDMAQVVGQAYREEPSRVEAVLGDGLAGFFLSLVCECVEAVVRNRQRVRAMRCLVSLVDSNPSCTFLYDDDVFGELVDVCDRMALVGSVEEQRWVVRFVQAVANTSSDVLTTDKRFELFRLVSVVVVSMLPYLREENASAAVDGQLLTDAFLVLASMALGFDDPVRTDLLSCLLYMFASVYREGPAAAVQAVLAPLRMVVPAVGEELGALFYSVVRQHVEWPPRSDAALLTVMVVATSTEVVVPEADVVDVVEVFMEGLGSRLLVLSLVRLCLQHAGTKHGSCPGMVRELVPRLIAADTPAAREVLAAFAKSVGAADAAAAYRVAVPLLVAARERALLMELAQENAAAFKEVVEGLGAEERAAVEQVLRGGSVGSDHAIELRLL